MMLMRRYLQVDITFPANNDGAAQTVTIGDDGDMELSVKVGKNCLIMQNTCTVDIVGLTPELRQRLMTHFTAWNYRKTPLANYAGIVVSAAYGKGTEKPHLTTIFKGDVVRCSPSGTVPNFSISIEAYTNQVDRSNLVPSSIPSKGTLATIVKAIASAANISADVSTSKADAIIENFGVFQVNPIEAPYVMSVSASLIMLNSLFPDSVFAWVDDDVIVVRDINTIIGAATTKIDTFVDGPPAWNEWGVSIKTMFNPGIKLAGAIEVKSKVNPGANGQFVVTQIDYDLASRQTPFYMTVKASPPASK